MTVHTVLQAVTRRSLVLIVLALLCVGLFPDAALGEDFRIVVHSSNPTSSLPRDEVARLFMKKRSEWPSGFPAVPVDQTPDRSIRDSFTAQIHGKKVPWVQSYWRTLLYSGRATPPLELESDRRVQEFVRNNLGAVGYVSADSALDSGLKVLEVTD